MRQTELYAAIARRTGIELRDVRDVMEGFIDVLALCIAVDDDVCIHRLGRFRPRASRAINLVAIDTGLHTTWPNRKGMAFTPAATFKTRLNNPAARPPVQPPRHPRRPSDVLAAEYKIPAHRAMADKPVFVGGKTLHELLWENRSKDNRTKVDVRALSHETGFHYDTLYRALQYLVKQGKIKRIARNGRNGVYEVNDPVPVDVDENGVPYGPGLSAHEEPKLMWG